MLPVLVGDPCHDSAVGFRPRLLILLGPLFLFHHLFLYLVLALFDERSLEPLFEPHVTDLLSMFLLQALTFVLLKLQ